jgi:hypothetical protein
MYISEYGSPRLAKRLFTHQIKKLNRRGQTFGIIPLVRSAMMALWSLVGFFSARQIMATSF